MKRRLWLSGLFSLLALTACMGSVPLEVRVNQTHSGKAVALHQGQELIVELQGGGDPQYAWMVASHGAAVFGEPTKQVIRLDSRNAATERFIFIAMRQGDDTIRIVERHVDGSSDEAKREFVLRVTVNK